MKDYLFFTLALVVALAIIAAAAIPMQERLDCGSVSGAGTNYQTVSVGGENLCRMQAAGQSQLKRVTNEDGDITSLVIDAGAGLLGDRPDRNPHFRLAADLEQQFAGFRIRTTIEAKPADAQGALAFEANYSAGQEGNSGWRKFNLKPGYDSYSFEWDVPVRRIADQAVDYLAIRPVVPEKHRAVEIRSIKFERLARTDVKPE